MSIVNFIENYRKKRRVLFTTPSHSQGVFVAPQSEKLIGSKFFSCDYSEIEGFDNLANPTGMIRSAQEDAAAIYGAKSTFFLTNGSTSGVVAAMYAVLNRNDKVVIARNCHKSVYNGLVLTGAVPIWLMPGYNSEWGIYDSLNLNYIEELLYKNKDVKAVIITNPTYEGVMFDISRISAICKKYNAILIVDEAHGALWHFHKAIGTPSLIQGADIVIQSLHKTAGALNPSALLHIGWDSPVEAKSIQQALNLITTTSPSYPLLLNIEATVNYLASKKGQLYIQNYIKKLNRLIRSLKTIPNMEVYSVNNDVTKILVKVTNMSGFELSHIMTGKYGIEDELANEKSVLYLTGIGTSDSKLRKLEKALFDLCDNNIILVQNKSKYEALASIEPRMRYTPSALWGKFAKEVDIQHSLARVSMELIADYPPGVPILLPGEVIKKEHIDYLSDTRKKIKVLA